MKNILLLIISILITFNSIAQAPFKTGINFPFRSPETTHLNDFLDRLSESGTPIMRQMTYADVYWKNVEPTNDNWNFTRTDSAFFNSVNIKPIGQLFSIMGHNDTVGIQVPWRSCSNPTICYWNPTTDSIDTKDYINTVIGRYKAVTNYWEITNEFENVTPPKGLHLLQKKHFLQYCYNWVKEADSSAHVLLPGMLGTYGYPISFSYDWLKTYLSIGGGSTFDIFNYHDYNSWWTLPEHLDTFKHILDSFGLTNKPIWITESSISSVNGSPITPSYSSPDQQAADVWRRICLLWAGGADVAFWHSQWSSADMSGWGEFGILTNNGIKKKSFHAYRLLIDKVSNFTTITPLNYGIVNNDNTSGGNGAWAIEFNVNGNKKWLLWSPDNQPYTLTNLSSSMLTATHVVPSIISPSGDSVVFQIDTLLTTSGNYTFNNLTSLPILIEEYTPVGINELKDNTHFNLYPNPASDYIYLKNINLKKVQLFNINGSEITDKTKILSKNDNINTIYIGELPKGLYIIKTETNSFIFDKK
ncbi:MAG: T9SS type A sorting domain-containing protein [Saprospiraceae bacterium]|nr:T9SS type A sorting domain-containing protein [Saprospiraceae bacterium]